MKLQRSRSLVSVLLFLACVVLVLLAQAQGGDNDPNKCHTDWDFCNSGTEAENEYYWRLGWCAAAIERGEVSASPSACMGQEEGTVSFPSSSPSRALPSSRHPSSQHFSSPSGDNKCNTDWDFCNSGGEAENAYHWRLGWCAAGIESGTLSVSPSECMGQPEGTVSLPSPISPPPPSSPPSSKPPDPAPPTGFELVKSSGPGGAWFYKEIIPPGNFCFLWQWDQFVPNTDSRFVRETWIAYCVKYYPIGREPEETPEPTDTPA